MTSNLSERLEVIGTKSSSGGVTVTWQSKPVLDELQAQILQDLEDMAVRCSRVAVPEGIEGHIVKAVPLDELRKYCEVER